MNPVRSWLRRAMRPIPARAQVALRRARRAAAGQEDTPSRIRRLRVAAAGPPDAVPASPIRALICAAQQAPPVVETSYAIATALRLRGHHVSGVLCDGLLPICEMALGVVERPACGACIAGLSRFEEAFGFAFIRLAGGATRQDREQAEALVESSRRSGRPVTVDGVELDAAARREVQRYRRGFVADPTADTSFDAWLVAGVLLARLFGRVLDRERPDVVITSSGRTLLASCLSAAARARHIRVVSWDTEPSFADGLVFSHGRPAVEIPLDASWPDAARTLLTAGERAATEAFLTRWARSDGTPFPYNPAPIESAEAIRAELGLRPAARLIAAFSNTAWDMAVVDRDVGFAGMFDWLYALVDYAVARPAIDLVVRAHPAEVRVPPDLRSRTPVCEAIRQRYGVLPSNVKLVDGSSPLSSYTLAAMADVPLVYASRLGLEIAVRGRRPWIAGDVTYRGRGFTRDLTSKQDMLAALDADPAGAALSPAEQELARRFAHLWFFRYVTRAPALRPPDGRFADDGFRALAPDNDATVDAVCDALVSGRPFLDLSSTPALAT